jgi:glycosyltransferase involved in cell wall biosynthesis
VSPVFRLLQLVPETLPSFRADVATLFGKYLPRHGIDCALVGRGPALHRQRWRNELAFAWHCIRSAITVPKKQVDLIQVRDMVSIGLVVLLVARLRGIPFAFWCSFLMSEGRVRRAREMLALRPSLHYRMVLWKGLIEKALFYRLLLPAADKVFVQSDAMLEWMVARGQDRAKLFAVPMGVDTEVLDRTTTPTRLPGWEGLPVLAYLGTLDSSRDLNKLIDVLAIVRRVYPNVRLLLIGDSPTHGDVDRLFQYAGLCGVVDALHVTGWLDSKAAWPLLAGADVAISYIPRGELFDISSPTKLLEYLALAMPCVGNDTPDQVVVLNRSEAGALSDSSAQAMANCVLAILDDPVTARVRAARGPAFIEAERSYRHLAETLSAQYLLRNFQ